MEILQSSELIASFSDKLWIIFKSDYHVTILITKLILVSLTHETGAPLKKLATDFAETVKFRCDLSVQKSRNVI